MKTTAKLKAIALAALAFASTLYGCVQPAQPDYRSSDKTFVSITFLKSDNPALPKDYEARWNAGRQVWMPAEILPWDIDISAIKARFVPSAGAKVYVDGVLQSSGIDANDFFGGLCYTVVAENGSSMEHRVVLDRETRPPAAGPLGQALTVMTYNAEMFEGGSVQTATIHQDIAAMIKNASAEIVVFVEISATGATGDIGPLQAALIAAGWAMPYVAYWDQSGDQDYAILSTYEIISSKTVVPPGIWPRPGLQAVIRVKNPSDDYVDLTVLDFHLKAMPDDTSLSKRIAQSRALADYFRSAYGPTLTSQYFLVAGDMNTVSAGDRGSTTSTMGYLQLLDDGDATNNFWASNESVWPGTATHQMGSVLDHIILSPGLKTRYRADSVAVKTSDPEMTMSSLSDHFPVLLELDL